MLKGTLDDFSLADVFKLLSFSKKTGRVELKRRAGMGRVFFRDGDVYYAESSLSREPLGQKLIRSRALTESHLRQALDEHADTGERVGQILLREGWITEEQLVEAVKQQIEDAVFDLLRWELGDFEWEPNASLEPEVALSVSVENLIMESSRRLDELELIFRKVPTSHAVVAVAPAPPEGAVEINITPDEWRVLVLVDGHRTVESIANTIGLDEFHTMKIVHGMVSAGLVEVTGSNESQEVPLQPSPAQHVEVEPAGPPPPPPPPMQEVPEVAHAEQESPVDEAPDDVAPEQSFESFGFESEGSPPDEVGSVAATEAEGALDEDSFVADVMSSFNEEALLPADEGLHEETLFEAGDEDALSTSEGATPPEEWFADPDLGTELFDSPSPGDLMTEFPTEVEVPSANGVDTAAMAIEVADAPPVMETAAEAVPVEEVDEPPVEAPPPPPQAQVEAPRVPPPPPVAAVEGEDRKTAVRELSGLFDEGFIERPRPVLRKIEPTDAAKRRVEDDEQVTKSLISRLIEGVKGL